MDQLINIKMLRPSVAPLDGFEQHTDLLAGEHAFKTHVGLAFLDGNLKRAPELANHFAQVPPIDGGWPRPCVVCSVQLR